jgi:hypothetical protein
VPISVLCPHYITNRYGGGKTRAPLVSPNPHAERDQWQQDLKTIKQLGGCAYECSASPAVESVLVVQVLTV